MIESLLEELPPHGGFDEQDAKSPPKSPAAPAHTSFLASLSVVQRILSRRRSQLDPAEKSDLFQDVALRLWRWRSKNTEKLEEMSDQDWDAFAARTAYNEVNRQWTRNDRRPSVLLEELSEQPGLAVEDGAEIEVVSLIKLVWQGICELSLRQRRSLLLHSQELIIYFLQIGVTDKALAEVLGFDESEWRSLVERLPMSDAEISDVMGTKAGSVKKSRFDARAKLERSIRR